MRISAVIILLSLFSLTAFTGPASGAAYTTKEEALKRAFPGAERVETVSLFLTPEETQEVTRLSGVPLDSSLYSFYAGKKGDEVVGYAAIEAATVRTLPETVMVVLDPEGKVRFVEVLAFFEPEEYLPPERWLKQFDGKVLSPQLRIGGEIQGITGATLSAQAITRQVRKTAALCRLLIGRP